MLSENVLSPDDLLPTLDRLVSARLAEGNIAGLSLACVGMGGVLEYVNGYTNVDAGDPVTPGTVFQAASLSKPVFAYAVLKACAEGLLNLDAPLSGYLPDPYIPDDPRLHRITARHVLSHTSGLPNWRPKEESLRIHFSAGERFAYSGEGYVYLQRVVEYLSGLSLDAWMRTRLLDPLGMHRSSYVWIEAYETLAARGHDGEGKPNELTRMREPNAAYSLYTTPAEFARFLAVLLDPPAPVDPACLATDQVAAMLVPQVPVNDAGLDATRPLAKVHTHEGLSWGLGWGLQHAPGGVSGRPTFWHWGDNGDFQAFVMGHPDQGDQGMALVCMANSQRGGELWADLFGLAFGRPPPAIAWLASL